MSIINKEVFCKIMYDMEKGYIFANKINELTNQYNRKEWINGYAFVDEIAENNIVTILSAMFDDENGWIQYWCYELNLGQDYTDGCISDENNNIIKLKTAEDLYDFLLDNREK